MDLNSRRSDWEKDAPRIALAGRSNPFLVPEDYFKEMHEHLTARIAIEELGKDPVFNVPEDYFNELPVYIEAKIAVEELKEELAAEGFKVPAGYFETLGQRIEKRTVPGKILGLHKIPGWINYAAAACITGIIGVTVFFNVNQNTINNRVSRLPDQAIESYLNLYIDQTDVPEIEKKIETKEAFSGIITNISEKDLEEYIEETSL